MATLNFLQIDALVPLPGATDVKEGFTRVPLTLCPPFSAQARASRAARARRRRAAPRHASRYVQHRAARPGEAAAPRCTRHAACNC